MVPDVHDLIRMPVDSVPRTNEIKEKMWVPGPDGDMYVTSLLLEICCFLESWCVGHLPAGFLVRVCSLSACFPSLSPLWDY